MEQTLQLQNSTTTGGQRQARRGPLLVGDVMSREPITATSEDSIAMAARKMSEHNVSCLVVVDKERVTGILTEKDVLKGVAGRDIEFHRLRVSERMSSPVEWVPPEMAVLEAGRIMEARNIRRLPVAREGRLIGIITETDITRGLSALNPLRYISDIMTPQVMTVDAEAKVDEVARIMARQGVSCVIACHRQEAAGIITEKDILRRVVALHKDPTQTRVAEIMSFPVAVVPPTYSVLSAGRKMETLQVHRLIVVDEKKGIQGVVTQTDILRAIRGAFEMVESQRRQVAEQFADLMRNVARDVTKAQEFLDQIQNPRTGNLAGQAAEDTDGRANLGAHCIL